MLSCGASTASLDSSILEFSSVFKKLTYGSATRRVKLRPLLIILPEWRMPQTLIRGMAWQHRRAVDPLLAAASAYEQAHPDVRIVWDARPLHGFEFTSVAELARAYDVIVLDHPFIGEVAESRCLLPLGEVSRGLAEDHFIGPSFASYRYDDALWAVPVDAACQTAVYRPDLLERLGCAVPRSVPEVLELGREARVAGFYLAIALAGVHALMSFFTLCAALGRACELREDSPFADPEIARESLALLRGILGASPPDVLDWNSIRLHEAMIERDDLVYCPAVYCYATYAEADMRRPLRFADLPATAQALPSRRKRPLLTRRWASCVFLPRRRRSACSHVIMASRRASKPGTMPRRMRASGGHSPPRAARWSCLGFAHAGRDTSRFKLKADV
jgi:Bacterial extracellular solute-binding protein